MKKALIFLIFLHVWLLPKNGPAESFPPRNSYVNDFAELLSPETKKTLEIILEDFEVKTSQQVFVATFPTHGDEPLESFTSRLANEWKIGYKDAANGVILVIFSKEHRAWIEVGAGLEDRIPFNVRRQLIRTEIAPHFRNGNYDTGTLEVVKHLTRMIEPKYHLPIALQREPSLIRIVALTAAGFLCLMFLLDLFSYFKYCLAVRRDFDHLYSMSIGVYSFLEWWLLYGLLANLCETIYFNFFIQWLNPHYLITARGVEEPEFRFRSRPGGRFRGNGTWGRW